jgi:hypothetical protein
MSFDKKQIKGYFLKTMMKICSPLMKFILLTLCTLLTASCVQKSFEVTPTQNINAPSKSPTYNGKHQAFGVPQHQTPLFEEKFYWTHDKPSSQDVAPPEDSSSSSN